VPINKIRATSRGKQAIAAAVLAAMLAGGGSFFADSKPPAVILATDTLILPWEGMVLKAHWDRFAEIYDICAGITKVNGKPVTAGMTFTRSKCEALTREQIYNEYYLPLVKQIPGFTSMPVGVQASMLSGAWNFGVAGMVKSTAARYHIAGEYRKGCEAQTAFNKSGIGEKRKIIPGLVLRREMGDAQRIGEAELCVSGLSADGKSAATGGGA
jgi:GH24 family phage-related lysozyme (muramidase)